MLVREPSQRASLADIMEHPWMKEEVRSVSKQALTPLVCRETLTDDDHWHIVQRIVDGKIASKEDVIQYVATMITLVIIRPLNVCRKLSVFLLFFFYWSPDLTAHPAHPHHNHIGVGSWVLVESVAHSSLIFAHGEMARNLA